MKKTCLFACMLLLFGWYQSRAATTPTRLLSGQHPVYNTKDATKFNPGIFRIQATNPVNGDVLVVYASLQYENEYNSGFGLYGDVTARFYADDQQTPVYVSGLTVNFGVIGYNGYNYYNYTSSTVVSGEYYVIESGAEHDYDDGDTFRYKDYHLHAGDYVQLSY